MTITWEQSRLLKQYEVYGYQVTYYLLEHESWALQAATQAMIELIKDHDFFQLAPLAQQQKVKLVCMKNALSKRASVLDGMEA